MAAEGLLNIDKPPGLTSHQVVNRIRRLTGMKRVGHSGTLDPLATGVLVLGIGRATRLLEYIVGQKKKYLAVIQLGQITDSYDADGQIVEERPVNVTRPQVEAALEPFRGTIEQQVPAFSAVKRDGRPLYERARKGEVVDRPVRRVTIYELSLISLEPSELTISVICSAGTYVRALAHDLGQALGCGGHIKALRRTRVGPFEIEDASRLDQLDPSTWMRVMLPPDAALGDMPRLTLHADDVTRLLQGQSVQSAGNMDGQLARAYDSSDQFVGLVRQEGEIWLPKKMFPPLEAHPVS